MQSMTNYEWNEDFYKEIVKDHNYRFPKYNSIDYPSLDQQRREGNI